MKFENNKFQIILLFSSVFSHYGGFKNRRMYIRSRAGIISLKVHVHAKMVINAKENDIKNKAKNVCSYFVFEEQWIQNH